MNRNLERNILRLGGTWNMINGLITVLGYSSWLKVEGISALTAGQTQNMEIGSSLIDSVYMIAVGYGFIQLVIGITNYIIVKNMRNNQIQKSFMIWLFALMGISIISADIVGTLIYVVLVIIYQARNKAIRLKSQY